MLVPVCRAYYKIQEIVEYYFPLWGWKDLLPTQGVVVDVGASPGGWTQYLASMTKRVIAIDPGNLRPEVSELANVQHIAGLVESSEAQLALKAACDEGKGTYERGGISVCVCDINVDVSLTAEILVKWVVPHMSNCLVGAKYSPFLIMTLKLMKSSKQKHIDFARDEAIRILSPYCEDFKVVHLNANSSNERTIVCTLKSLS